MIVKCLCNIETDMNKILAKNLQVENIDSAVVHLPLDRMEHKCECGRIYHFNCYRMMEGDEN